jgi:hypothetical protein
MENIAILVPGRLSDPEWKENFGNNLAVCIGLLKLTPRELGLKIGLAEAAVIKILNGNEHLSPLTIEKITNSTRFPLNALIRTYPDVSSRLNEFEALTDSQQNTVDGKSTEVDEYNLSDMTVRTRFAESVIALIKINYPEDKISSVFLEIRTGKNVSWLYNLKNGNATLNRAIVETCATFFRVDIKSLLSGEWLE